MMQAKPKLTPIEPVPERPEQPGPEAYSTSRQLYTLKHADTFVVTDILGDILGDNDGLFQNDTRILSRLVVRLDGEIPSLLGSGLSQDNTVFTAHTKIGRAHV
jgi:hypothetical protein